MSAQEPITLSNMFIKTIKILEIRLINIYDFGACVSTTFNTKCEGPLRI